MTLNELCTRSHSKGNDIRKYFIILARPIIDQFVKKTFYKGKQREIVFQVQLLHKTGRLTTPQTNDTIYQRDNSTYWMFSNDFKGASLYVLDKSFVLSFLNFPNGDIAEKINRIKEYLRLKKKILIIESLIYISTRKQNAKMLRKYFTTSFRMLTILM